MIPQQLQQYAMNMINQNSSQFAGNPQAQELINIIQTCDEKKGIEFATNFLKSNNWTQEEGIKKAFNFFGL